jgi:hypothetical protein
MVPSRPDCGTIPTMILKTELPAKLKQNNENWTFKCFIVTFVKTDPDIAHPPLPMIFWRPLGVFPKYTTFSVGQLALQFGAHPLPRNSIGSTPLQSRAVELGSTWVPSCCGNDKRARFSLSILGNSESSRVFPWIGFLITNAQRLSPLVAG